MHRFIEELNINIFYYSFQSKHRNRSRTKHTKACINKDMIKMVIPNADSLPRMVDVYGYLILGLCTVIKFRTTPANIVTCHYCSEYSFDDPLQNAS